MQKIFLVFIFILQILCSCSNKKENKRSSPKVLIKAKELHVNKSDNNILLVLRKMSDGKQLNKVDYQIICEFLQNNNDEALAEEVGYAFYTYFKMNASENSNFKSFIINLKNKKEILIALIQIMCLDLGEDNYNSKTLQRDYPIFNGEVEVLKSFEQCIGFTSLITLPPPLQSFKSLAASKTAASRALASGAVF